MRKGILRFLVLTLMFSMLCACSSGGNSGSASYKVTFDLNGGTLISGETEQTVKKGESATPPKVEKEYCELTWSGDYTNIQKDTVITAEWEAREMSSQEVAAFASPAVVTVNAGNIYGNSDSSAKGSGFFIDDEGTLITCYHVIEGANELSVTVADGGTYDVSKVEGFSPLYDIAVLKVKYESDSYLNINTDSVSLGEKVYAIGSSLGELDGSFTSGTLSSLNRSYGNIECYQMDAAISSGNSGGPLVDSYGNAIGICAYSYEEGQNNNLAIKLEQLDKVDTTKNYSMTKYVEWIDTETDKSYSPYDSDYIYYYSIVNRYEVVNSDSSCVCSLYTDENEEIQTVEGFVDCCEGYYYAYDSDEYDNYIEYLESIGFEYDTDSSSTDQYYYINAFMDIEIVIMFDTDYILVIPGMLF